MNGYLKAVLDVIVLGDIVDSGKINIASPVGPAESILSKVFVLEPNEDVRVIIDSVSEEEVILQKDLAAYSVGSHDAEGEIVVSNDSSIVPGQVRNSLVVEVDPKTVIGVAVLALIGGSQTKADVLEGLVAVESSVKVPFLVPLLD